MKDDQAGRQLSCDSNYVYCALLFLFNATANAFDISFVLQEFLASITMRACLCVWNNLHCPGIKASLGKMMKIGQAEARPSQCGVDGNTSCMI